MSDAQIPSPEPTKKHWWVAGIVVPIIVALIGVVGQWHKPEVHPDAPPPIVSPPQNPNSVSSLVWGLPIVGFVLGAGLISVLVGGAGDDLPTPVFVLLATSGIGFAIWAAILSNSDYPRPGPLPVMILLTVSGISMLGFGIACHSRELAIGTYVGYCAALVAMVFLILWETGNSGGWVNGDSISEAPGPFQAGYAFLVTLGVLFSPRNALAWISLALAGISFVSTVVLDLNQPNSEAGPLCLGVFLLAIIVAHFALRGRDFEDLSAGVRRSLVYLGAFGGFALLALGILGFTTNATQEFNWAAVGVGLLAAFIGSHAVDQLHLRL
jgi:hypothetical protein